MNILGLNAYHGDTSAALLVDGRLACAMEEERFTRLKHQAGFPSLAVRHSLDFAGLAGTDLDHIAISRDPSAHLHRKLMFALSQGPSLSTIRDRMWNVSRLRDVKTTVAEAIELDESAVRAQVHRVEHHRAHLASAFFASPFDEAAVVSIDGFGDFSSVMWGVGRANRIDVRGNVAFPHSLGLFYTAFTPTPNIGAPRLVRVGLKWDGKLR